MQQLSKEVKRFQEIKRFERTLAIKRVKANQELKTACESGMMRAIVREVKAFEPY